MVLCALVLALWQKLCTDAAVEGLMLVLVCVALRACWQHTEAGDGLSAHVLLTRLRLFARAHHAIA